MYTIFINLTCFLLAFCGNERKRKEAFRVFMVFNLGEYLLFNQSGFDLGFNYYFSIVAIECFILSLLILNIYGKRNAMPFYVFNLVLSFTYLLNIYFVNVLNNKALWILIYNNQEIIGCISVLLLMDIRVVKNVVRKYFFNFKRHFIPSNDGRIFFDAKMDKA